MNGSFPHVADEIVRLRAYELWDRRGRPLWDDLRDWFEAKCQLRYEVQASPTRVIEWRAIQLWDKTGRPIGRDVDFWLEAEREVQRMREAALSVLVR